MLFECHLWLHIGPLSTPFLEIQNSHADSNQESTGDAHVFCAKNALFPLFCCQHMRHESCTQFSFFLNHQTECTIILQLALWSSFKTAATRVMFSFVFVVLSLPLHSASSINSSTTTNWLCHQNSVPRNTDESPNAFTNISQVFTDVNPTLQQNFITTRKSKFLSMVIYNTCTNIRYCKMLLYCHILTD